MDAVFPLLLADMLWQRLLLLAVVASVLLLL
jgi:hypothetical protein